jgi:hypothetical protein
VTIDVLLKEVDELIIDDLSKEVTIDVLLKEVDELIIDDLSKEVQEITKFAPHQGPD